MNVLMIEDEPNFVAYVSAAATVRGGVTVLSGDTLGLSTPFVLDSGPVEDQLVERFQKIRLENAIDLVLLDTDLSRYQNGLSQSACRQALQQLGIPVCRYSKQHSITKFKQLERLTKLAMEGANSIWVPSEQLERPKLAERLIPWLISVGEGFQQLRCSLNSAPELHSLGLGPSGMLAELLKLDSLRSDLLGYTGQNLFFFGSGFSSSPDEISLKLGYWLKNYILEFPGPILNEAAAAAYLNITHSSIQEVKLTNLLANCRYRGPFSSLENFYLRSEIDNLLDGLDGDLANSKELGGIRLERVDPENPETPAYYCVLKRQPIPEVEAASSPDWIPPGAQTARISQDVYAQLGPMLEQ